MQRQLLIGGVGLVRGRVRNTGPIMAGICEELEPLLDEIAFTVNAPFQTVSLILRFGKDENLIPEYSAIDSRHNELPVAVEIAMSHVENSDSDELRRTLLIATLKSLVHIGKKYELPIPSLEKRLANVLSVGSTN